MLRIYSTDPQYITLARNALDQLAGVAHAWTYTHTMGVFVGDWIEVTRGAMFATAQGVRPHSVTLIDRVIANRNITRIIHSHANDASPERDLPGLRSDDWFSGIGRRVMDAIGTTARATGGIGTGTLIRWSGGPNSTANQSAMGIIRMEACPNYILLAHELVHADRFGRGLLNLQRGNSPFAVDWRQDGRGSALYHHNGFQLVNEVWMDGTMELAEEIATVGLSDSDHICPNDPLAITENMIRREHGIPQRLKYGAFNRPVEGVFAFFMNF